MTPGIANHYLAVYQSLWPSNDVAIKIACAEKDTVSRVVLQAFGPGICLFIGHDPGFG